MQRNVETLIGRLVTDAALRRAFSANPAAVLEELAVQGLELTATERDALSAIDCTALYAFAKTLDRRLCRARLSITQKGD